MAFNEAEMRARFWEIKPQLEAIMEQSKPLRAKRDELLADAAALVKPLDAKIKAIEAPAAELAKEMALIVRALNGKTAPAA